MEFIEPLRDVEVLEKESARFECKVSRESAKVCIFAQSVPYRWRLSRRLSDICPMVIPQVCWFKDGCEIRKGKKYEILADGLQRILIVHKSAMDDEAEYECDARTSKSSGMLTVIGEAYRPLRRPLV